MPTLAQRLSGDWYQVIPIPGSSMVFYLSAADSTLAGTGNYTIEAGRPGTVSVAGSYTSERIRFELTRSDGNVLHFDGTLTSSDRLDGYAWYSMAGQVVVSDPAPIVFQRVVPMKL